MYKLVSVVFKGYHCATLLSSFCLLFHCATISLGEGGRVETHSRVVKFFKYFLHLQRKLRIFKINIKDRSKYCFSKFSIICSDCIYLKLIPRGGGRCFQWVWPGEGGRKAESWM